MVTICALAAPGAALAADSDSVAMVSDVGDWVGQGNSYLAMPPSGTVTATMNAADRLTVDMTSGADYFTLEFRTAGGATMVPGVYDNAQRQGPGDPAYPGIDIFGSGRGCNTVTGSFVVKDIAFTGSTVNRLWLVFVEHCEGGAPALFGEIRIGESGPAGAAALAPASVQWPTAELATAASPATTVPVTIRAASALSITDAHIQGTDASEFTIRGNTCAGVSLATGDTCQVLVRYERLATGDHSAQLALTDSDGSHYSVSVRGANFRTRYVYVSDPNDWVGEGTTGTYGTANSDFSATGTPHEVSFVLNGADGYEWDGHFSSGTGSTLTAGTTYTATRWPYNGFNPGLDVGGREHGCSDVFGTFTIREIAFDSNNNMTSFGLTFVQRCFSSGPALCGIVEFRASGPSPGNVPPGNCQGLTTVSTGGGRGGGSTGSGGADGSATTSPTTSPSGSGLTPTTTAPAPTSPAPTPVKRTIPRGSPCAVARFSKLHAVIGTAGANKLSGGPRADRIFGLAGRDVLRGGDGADCIDGGAGNDTLYGGLGHDVLNCGPGHDLAYTTPGDVVHGCERTIREHPKKWVKL